VDAIKKKNEIIKCKNFKQEIFAECNAFVNEKYAE
jgi:hypothetical protein